MCWMKRRHRLLILGIVGVVAINEAHGQTIERDTTITGPRGRTINRDVEIQRRPGSIERSIQIQRPGGTFERQVQVQRAPGWRPPIGGPGPRGAWLPRPVIVGARGVWIWLARGADAQFLVRRQRWRFQWRIRRWSARPRRARPRPGRTRSGTAARPGRTPVATIAELLLEQSQGGRLRPRPARRPAGDSILDPRVEV